MKIQTYMFLAYVTTIAANCASSDGSPATSFNSRSDTQSSGAPPSACAKACDKFLGCLGNADSTITNTECTQVCEALPYQKQNTRISCLNAAQSTDCDAIYSCMSSAGACYWSCTTGSEPGIPKCRSGYDMTEDSCRSDVQFYCNEIPKTAVYNPDCECGEDSNRCPMPSWFE